MDITYHPVAVEQKDNNAILRQGVVGAKCLYEGHPNDYAAHFDIEQLTCMAGIDNSLMKHGGNYFMNHMEVYANGAINVFIKSRVLNSVVMYVTIRPSADEQEYYDRLAEQHGQAD